VWVSIGALPPTPRERSLSELESAALGHVWKHGPCTAHAVRTLFQGSPSSYWSASAGAIYPLLSRLEKRGLVSAREEARGSRKRRLLTVTERGRRALEGWLTSGVDPSIAAAVFDAVRTRVFFLGAVPAGERRRFLRSARRELERHLALVEGDVEAARLAGERYRVLGARGAWHTAKARLAWVEEMELELGSSAGKS